MRKITGYEKYSEHIHAVNWGVKGHQGLRMLLRQMQRWGLLPAKYSPSLLHSRPYEKECPKVFDLRKPKYKPRTGVHAVTTLVPSAMRHSLTLQPLFAYVASAGLVAYACLPVYIRYMWFVAVVCQLWPGHQVSSNRQPNV